MESIYDIFANIRKKNGGKSDLSRKEINKAVKEIRKEYKSTPIGVVTKKGKFVRVGVNAVCNAISSTLLVHVIRYKKSINLDKLYDDVSKTVFG